MKSRLTSLRTFSMDDSLPGDPRFEQLVEKAIARLQDGQSIETLQLDAEHPEYAEQFRELLPAIEMLARLGNAPARQAPSGDLDHSLPATQQQQELGDYRIIRELGRGGMGVVYQAEQMSLGRRVALKVLPFAGILDQQQLARFKNEARAAATLHHPNIVPIHAVGSDRGVHYYAMQLIDGQSLARVVEQMKVSREARGARTARRGEGVGEETRPVADQPTLNVHNPSFSDSSSPQYFRVVAQLGHQAADALDHAHQNGILHRDIKPGNLLLDNTGNLWVTDFGLARIEADAGLTMTGDVLGTLRYMSPEQALGKRVVVDHRCDIYSLGATLYEFLTLQPPFTGKDRQELLRQFASEEPPRPRQINPRIPQDLETIILKALAKNPSDRYVSAQALAEDLSRFLAGRPIQAKAVSLNERVFRWANRNRAFTTACFGSLIVVALVALIASALVLRANSRTAAALKESRASESKAKHSERQTRELLYAADMALAGAAWHRHSLPTVREILDRYAKPKTGADGSSEEDLRGFEWHFLDQQTRNATSSLLYENKEPLYLIQLVAGGEEFLTAGKDGIVRWHDGNTGKVVRNLETKQTEVNKVPYNSARTRFATAGDDGTVKIWNAANLSLIHSIKLHEDICYWATFLNDEKLIAGGYSASLKLIDVTTGELLREYAAPEAKLAHGESPRSFSAFPSNEGHQFWSTANSTKGTYRGIYQWNVQTGEARKVSNDSALCNILLDASEKFLFVNTNHGICIRDAHSGEELWSFGLDNQCEAMILSPDERRLVVSDRDGQVYVWDIDLSNPAKIVPAASPDVYSIQKSAIYSVAFAPNGKSLLTVGTDGCVRRTVFSPKQPFREVTELRNHSPLPHASADSVAVAARDSVPFVEPKTGKLNKRLSFSCYPANESISGEMLVAARASGNIGIWRVATGELIHGFRCAPDKPTPADFLSDGSLLVVWHDQNGKRIELVDPWKGTTQQFSDPRNPPRLAFHVCMDDGLLALMHGSEQLVCWNRHDKSVRWQTAPLEMRAPWIYVSSDRKSLIAADGDIIALVDCATGKIRYRTRCDRSVNNLAFIANNRSFVVDGPPGKLSVWHTATGQCLFEIADLGTSTSFIQPLESGFLAAVHVDDPSTKFVWYEF